MRTVSGSALMLLVVATSVLLGAATTSAAPPRVKTKVAKLDVDVAGYVVTDRLHDTKSDCFPGQRWLQPNEFTFESGRPVPVKLTNVSLPGVDPVTTSSLSNPAGPAVSKGSLSEYAE